MEYGPFAPFVRASVGTSQVLPKCQSHTMADLVTPAASKVNFAVNFPIDVHDST